MPAKSRVKTSQTVSTNSGSSTSNKHKFSFSWADDVEDTYYQEVKEPSVSSERALSVAYATGAHYATIEGKRYLHSSNPPAIFTSKDQDRRFEYEHPPPPNEISPTSETSDERELNDAPIVPSVAYVQKKPNKKKNKRRKGDPLRGPQTSPSNLRSDTYAEMMAAQDELHRNLPHANQVLVPVNPEPIEIVENLWEDYDQESSVPIYMG